jgi:alpha-1,6-mannosyltransferase
MNKYLISTGLICSLLWGFITSMTFGIPLAWCRWVDRFTLHYLRKEVFQLANGFYYDTNNNDMPTVMFLILFGVIFSSVFTLIWQIEHRRPEKYSLKIIIFFSLLFRLIILPGELIHESDIYRYLWDGKVATHNINPYKYAPADLFMYERGYVDDYYDARNNVTIKGRIYSDKDIHRLDTLIKLRDKNPVYFNRIGHPSVPTIYPPAAEAFFILSVFLRPDSVLLMKFIFLLFDIGVLFLIIGLLKHFNKDPCFSLIYGWSPLVLKEIANSGHYDSIPIFFTMLSIFLFFKRHHMAGIGALALATLSKFFSVVLLPFFARSLKKGNLLLFGGLLVLFYFPYILWDQTGLRGVFQGLVTYNEHWFYNSSVFTVGYVLLKRFFPLLTETLIPSKMIVGIIYIGILIYLICKDRSRPVPTEDVDMAILHKCFWAVAILFIINPVGDPWYFCWSIPFLCFFPYRSWILLSGLLILSYLNFHTDIGFVNKRIWEIKLINWLIYVPFFVVLVAEIFRKPKFIQQMQCKERVIKSTNKGEKGV